MHDVRIIFLGRAEAVVGCGQSVALVPASTKKLAPENVVFRPLKETVSVVTTALAWNRTRQHAMVDAAVALLRKPSKGQ